MRDAEALLGGEPLPRGLSDRYEILEVLGQGAMGIVYKARDRELDRIVAVKTIHPDSASAGASFTAFTTRLYQEATAAARLSHPGIVAVYDVGRGAGLPYIVMEYLQGRTLAEIAADGPVAPERAVDVVVQVCRALEYAHAQGVIHRDIKSSNIMVDADWRVKLTDFGVARVVDKHAAQTGMMVGTPAYMSPEQVRGLEADARSDLFSLGVVLYEALTGEKAFPGDDFAAVLDDVLQVDPIPARERNFAVTPALDAVVRRAMSKEASDRYPDAGAFADALTQALAVDDSPRSGVLRRLARGCRPLVAVGALLVTAAAAAVFVIALNGRDSRLRLPDAPIVVPRTTAPGRPGSPAAPWAAAKPAAPSPLAPPGARGGCLSVNALPFAAVYVDGHRVGDTPRACVRIRAGRHRIYFQSRSERSPEHVIVVEERHTSDNPLRVSYDFRLGQFLAR